jgi:hypothetical protein
MGGWNRSTFLPLLRPIALDSDVKIVGHEHRESQNTV